MKRSMAALAAGVGMLALAGVGDAYAATITFGSGGGSSDWVENGFNFTSGPQRNNSGGQCPYSDPACANFNKNDSSTMTYGPSPGTTPFDLLSFDFQISGNAAGQSNDTNTVLVQGYNGANLIQSLTLYVGFNAATLSSSIASVFTDQAGTTAAGIIGGPGSADYHVVLNLAGWSNLTSVVWSNGGPNNTWRLDNINATPVPIPGAALLFGTALAGVGFMSRRKKAASAA